MPNFQSGPTSVTLLTFTHPSPDFPFVYYFESLSALTGSVSHDFCKVEITGKIMEQQGNGHYPVIKAQTNSPPIGQNKN